MSSIFGNTTQNKPASTGLFGNLGNSNNTATSTAPPASSLFGGSNANNSTPTSSTSLFGGNTATAPKMGGSLFGNTSNNPAPQPTSSSLFGGNTNTSGTGPSGNSMFGGSTNTNVPQTGNSLFGGNAAVANNQTPAFGTSAQNAGLGPQGAGAFGNSTNQPGTNPALAAQASLLQSGLGASNFGALGQVSQMELAKSRLMQLNVDARPNEKSIVDRIQALIRKWDPNSQDTLLQDYVYNAVNAAYAPFYYRNPEDTEKEWEEALARKPANIETKEGDTVSFIPVLVRGFRALGERAEVQARTVNEMRARLHEMNNSLTAVMTKHQQNITVRLESARRRHVTLSQRCLRMAVKIQVLRNRGYALDNAEEELRRTLMGLEKQVLDPSFAGREEEIWARMLALRERTRWLEEEGQRLGQKVVEQDRQGVPEDVVIKTKKILRDYNDQLAHLHKEIEEVKKELADWEEAQKPSKR